MWHGITFGRITRYSEAIAVVRSSVDVKWRCRTMADQFGPLSDNAVRPECLLASLDSVGKPLATTEDLSFRDTRFEATWAKVRYGALPPKWMSYRRRVVQDARRSRPSHSRSEVLSLTRSDHGAVRQRPESRFDGKITVPGTSPPAPMCCIAAYQPHDRCTRACEGRRYRINSPRDSPIGLVVL